MDNKGKFMDAVLGDGATRNMIATLCRHIITEKDMVDSLDNIYVQDMKVAHEQWQQYQKGGHDKDEAHLLAERVAGASESRLEATTEALDYLEEMHSCLNAFLTSMDCWHTSVEEFKRADRAHDKAIEDYQESLKNDP